MQNTQTTQTTTTVTFRVCDPCNEKLPTWENIRVIAHSNFPVREYDFEKLTKQLFQGREIEYGNIFVWESTATKGSLASAFLANGTLRKLDTQETMLFIQTLDERSIFDILHELHITQQKAEFLFCELNHS